MNTLPNETIKIILSFISFKDVLNFLNINKYYWNNKNIYREGSGELISFDNTEKYIYIIYYEYGVANIRGIFTSLEHAFTEMLHLMMNAKSEIECINNIDLLDELETCKSLFYKIRRVKVREMFDDRIVMIYQLMTRNKINRPDRNYYTNNKVTDGFYLTLTQRELISTNCLSKYTNFYEYRCGNCISHDTHFKFNCNLLEKFNEKWINRFNK